MAATAAAVALATVPMTFLKDSNLLLASSAVSPLSSMALEKSFVSPSVSSISSPISSMAFSFCSTSRSIALRAASALFSCTCQFCVRLSFSPNDSAEFCKAERRVSIFCFCASICLLSTSFFAERASTDFSFLSKAEVARFISDFNTLNWLLISVSADLNSFSPSTPIFKPKSEAIQPPPFVRFHPG